MSDESLSGSVSETAPADSPAADFDAAYYPPGARAPGDDAVSATDAAETAPPPDDEQPAPHQEPPRQWSTAHAEWSKYLGVPPEHVDAMARSGKLQEIADLLQLKQQQSQKPQPTQQQTPAPQPPASDVPPEFTWDANGEAFPQFQKYGEYQKQQYLRMQSEIDRRLSGYDQQLQQMLTPVQALIQQQRQAQVAADYRSVNQAVDSLLNDPEVFGTSDAPQQAARQKLFETASWLLQNGRAADWQDAAQKAYRLEHGDRIGRQQVQQAASRAQQRAAQVVARPGTRDSELPAGREKAIQTAQRLMNAQKRGRK